MPPIEECLFMQCITLQLTCQLYIVKPTNSIIFYLYKYHTSWFYAAGMKFLCDKCCFEGRSCGNAYTLF
jgi:hypothetical protein